MTNVILSTITIAAAIWVGAIVFHSAVVAPSVFADLDEPTARRFLRTLFPRFFKLGLICGGIMLLALAAAGVTGDWSGLMAAILTGTLAMTVLEAISLAMVPAINASRDAGASGVTRFRRLHTVNVLLTVVILLLGLAVLAALASGAA